MNTSTFKQKPLDLFSSPEPKLLEFLRQIPQEDFRILARFIQSTDVLAARTRIATVLGITEDAAYSVFRRYARIWTHDIVLANAHAVTVFYCRERRQLSRTLPSPSPSFTSLNHLNRHCESFFYLTPQALIRFMASMPIAHRCLLQARWSQPYAELATLAPQLGTSVENASVILNYYASLLVRTIVVMRARMRARQNRRRRAGLPS